MKKLLRTVNYISGNFSSKVLLIKSLKRRIKLGIVDRLVVHLSSFVGPA